MHDEQAAPTCATGRAVYFLPRDKSTRDISSFKGETAQAFSGFYQKFHVLDEPDAEKKAFLLWMTDYFRAQLERTLDVLGIEVPEFM